MKLQPAKKKQIKLRIGLSGPSGFGKTYSALLLAYGMTQDWTKIAVIDTENSSANLYSKLGNYSVLHLESPFSPERYIEALRVAVNASMEVVIIDSISHEWNGKGGCLELQEKLGGRFQDWAKITPRHQAFIDAILGSKSHIITTVRRKVDYSMDKDISGKTKVVKMGTKEITREGFEYELTLNLELINDNHLVKASKDRTGLFMNKPEFVITKGTGKILRNWCEDGEKEEDVLSKINNEINSCLTIEGLRHIYGKYPNLQLDIKDRILQKKSEIENVQSQIVSKDQFIQQNKNKSENGIDRSTREQK